MEPAAVNTALLTVSMALIGIVSFVLRSLLTNIQSQLAAIMASVNAQGVAASTGRDDAVGDLRTIIQASSSETDLRLERLTRAVELSARTELLRLIGSPDVRPEVKVQANAIIEEIASVRRERAG